jgi:PadR family transcriptional regulator, regulatory protein AphA
VRRKARPSIRHWEFGNAFRALVGQARCLSHQYSGLESSLAFSDPGMHQPIYELDNLSPLRANCLSFYGENRVGSSSHIMTTFAMTKKIAKISRNPAEYPILGILFQGPIHGYDICRVLGDGIGSIWRLGKSQVYALLMRLERQGLVIHERVGQDNLPAKNIFSLTEQGEDVFNQWVDQPIPHMRDMRLEFLTKLWFARQIGSEMETSLIDAQLDVCREKAEGLKKLKGACRTEIEALSADFRLDTVEATISWLERLLNHTARRPSRSKETQRER